MSNNTLTGTYNFTGPLYAPSLYCNGQTLTDTAISPAAAISQTKLQHQHRVKFAQTNTAVAVTDEQGLHIVYGVSGTVLDFRASMITACAGAATVTVDLLKNGSSILSAPITLNNTQSARQAVQAALASTTLAQGDQLDVNITATAGGGTLGRGLLVSLTLAEAAQ